MNLVEARTQELSEGLRKVRAAEVALQNTHRPSVCMDMNDGREIRGTLTIDYTVLKAAKGYIKGVYNEMMADGQEAVVRDIFDANRNGGAV